jgi:DNA-binding NarL/FixJ family response regulator
MMRAPFLLHGLACGRCGHPGHQHDPRTGLTHHVDRGLPACLTHLPNPETRTVFAPPPDSPLPPNVARVLRLYGTGLDAQQLATHLAMPVGTVRKRLETARQTFDVTTTWEAVRIAHTRGLFGEVVRRGVTV